MGEAKRRRDNSVPMVYHHTSNLRTNLIWMSGMVQVEGQSKGVFHPTLGEIKSDASLRRPLKDFPPVAWFTTRIQVPKVLMASTLVFQNDSGERSEIDVSVEMANGIALNRIALGFPIGDIPVTRWPDHAGYHTAEGAELNDTARHAGDDPNDWYVSEEPIDVLRATEVWTSTSIMKPKLVRNSTYLKEVHRMVRLCRDRPGVYIPPTWLTPEQAQQLTNRMGLPVGDLSGRILPDR